LPLIKYRAGDLEALQTKNALTPETVLIQSLYGVRLTFEIFPRKEEAAAQEGDCSSIRTVNLSGILDFVEIVGDERKNINPIVFDDEASVGVVATRIEIDQGEIVRGRLNEDVTWKLSASLGGSFDAGELAKSLFVKFCGDRLDIRLDPLRGEGSSGSTLSFLGGEETVDILVGNLCQADLLHIFRNQTFGNQQMGAVSTLFFPEEKVKAGIRDEDFRWYYQLAKDRDEIKASLSSGGLPIPEVKHVKEDGDGGGYGQCQCMCIRFAGTLP